VSPTIFFLRFLGPILVIVGSSVFLNQKQYAKIVKDLQEFSLAYYLSAVIALMLGLFMVLMHNLWSTMEEIVVSVVGWLTLCKGSLRLLAPRVTHAMVRAVSPAYFSAVAVFITAVGVWMCWKGFAA
jgi:hypothetical protein